MLEEQSDKLIIRIIFVFVVIGILYVYKYAHRILYPTTRNQIFKKMYPSINSADTIHYLSRIIGFGIIFSYVQINVSNGIALALFSLIFQSLVIMVIYLLTLFVGESIALYNFTYMDEINKRKNMAYAMICFSQSISVALLIKTVLQTANNSLILIFFLWLYASVLFGFSIKLFKFYSKLNFNHLVTQKNKALALSYSGFIIGCSYLIRATMSHRVLSIPDYIQIVLLEILLCIIIFPLFVWGIRKVFLLQKEINNKGEFQFDVDKPELGYGVYEGGVFATAAFLTGVITAQILFGHFYPTY